MKENVDFTLHGLLRIDDEGNVSGPFSPVTIAKEFAKGFDIGLNGLVRINFVDEDYHAEPDGEEGPAIYDILCIRDLCIRDSEKNPEFFIFADRGVDVLPIALINKSLNEASLTTIYEESEFIKKLNLKDLEGIKDAILESDEFTVKKDRQYKTIINQ